MYIGYIDALPKIPEYLLEDPEVIASMPQNPSSKHGHAMWFKVKQVPKELHDWLQSIFPFEIYSQYQVMNHELPKHKDPDRDIALNYLLTTGGNGVSTVAFHPLYSRERVQTMVIEEKRWHYIKTKMFHRVYDVDPDKLRIAISVIPKNQKQFYIDYFGTTDITSDAPINWQGCLESNQG